MPRIALQAEPTRFSLKSLPPDGYVVIKPLSFGQALERRQLATKLSVEQQAQRRKQSGAGDDSKPRKPDKMDIAIMQRASREYEFAYCIIEHNIEGPDGTPLNFKDRAAIDRLPKDLGEEIEKYLDEVNGEDNEEDLDFLGSESIQSSAKVAEGSATSKETQQ